MGQLVELDALADAIQALINATSDEPLLLSQAIVVYEAAGFDSDDGAPQRIIRYANPTENFSLSGAIGLLDAGRFYVRHDILGSDDGEDD